MSGLPLGIVQLQGSTHWRDDSARKRNLNSLNPCPFAALMFPSFFIYILILFFCFTRAFMNSSSSSGSLPLLLCHLILPLTSQPRAWGGSQWFCSESTNLHQCLCCFLALLNGIISVGNVALCSMKNIEIPWWCCGLGSSHMKRKQWRKAWWIPELPSPLPASPFSVFQA